MSIVQDLSIIALRHVATAVGSVVGEAVFNLLVDRFTNHTEQLNRALQKANERAWQTLEGALVGPSIFDFLKSADDKVITEQMKIVLDNQLKPVVERKPEFCKKCLAELRAARKEGTLTRRQGSPVELARQVVSVGALRDPLAVLDAEWKRIQKVADELREAACPNLAELLRLRPGESSPILASSVRYFFRLEIEANPRAFQGLAVAKLEGISERQEKMLAAMTTLLTQHGQRFAEVMDEVLIQLGVIEVKVDAIKVTVDVISENQCKLQKGQEDLRNEVRAILETVNLHNRAVRLGDSYSIRSDGDLQRANKAIEKYHNLTVEQRQRSPELLNDVAKLEVATGDNNAAHRDFREVATLLPGRETKAAAYFNAYQAALVQKKWDQALSAIKEAVALDPARFAPFPFEKYGPESILGAGGFGVVFRCKHDILGDSWVIKSLRTDDMNRDIKDVFSEAITLRKLKHPAIIRLIDCAFADGAKKRPFLVMNYFDAKNLQDYVESEGLLSPTDLLEVAIPVAEALQVAHANGILHRDVKPGNILVRREAESWRVKLIDFGLAIQPDSFEGKASTQGPQDQTIASKSIAGTREYAAPEQMGALAGIEVGPYSDVYAFGRTCYYALCKQPEPDETEKATIPEPWRKFLGRCTGRQPANRPADFTAVLAEMRELASVKPPVPDPEPPPEIIDQERPAPVQPGGRFLYLNAKEISAKGYESDEEFVVLAGSQAVTGAVASCLAHLVEARNDLIQKRIMVEEFGRLTLKQDRKFSSASFAAGVLLGRSANGRIEWKDADGRTLKAIQNGEDPEKALNSKLKRLERKIKRTERFEVRIKHNGDRESFCVYPYERAANKDLTVAEWRRQRFTSWYPDCEVKVLLANGSEANGVMKLSNVRATYFDE